MLSADYLLLIAPNDKFFFVFFLVMFHNVLCSDHITQLLVNNKFSSSLNFTYGGYLIPEKHFTQKKDLKSDTNITLQWPGLAMELIGKPSWHAMVSNTAFGC